MTTSEISPELRAQLGVLDVEMAARLLGCSPETVKEQAAAGTLPHVRLGRSPVFPVAALLDHLNARAKTGAQMPEPTPAVRSQPLAVFKGRKPTQRPLPRLPDLD